MFYFIPLLIVCSLLIGGAFLYASSIRSSDSQRRSSVRGETFAPSSLKAPIAMATIGLVILIIGTAFWPQVNVYAREMQGRAELAEADFSRQVKVAEALAVKDSAVLLADAEVLRATGAAEANRIIQDGLGGPEGYLRYLAIQAMEKSAEAGNKLIYIPTEATIPITEAGRVTNK